MICEPRDVLRSALVGRRVLVVDDDEILCEVMRGRLNSLGWTVETAKDGEAAIKLLAQAPPDLAIVDLNMPNVNGYELLRHIRQSPRTLDLPVIVCTSLNDPEAIEKAYRLGASSFFTKPINWPQFLHHAPFVMRNGETERALRLAQTEALAASRTKSAMFQVLSHELKTPLTALIGLTSVMEEKLKAMDGVPVPEQMEHVVEAAQRLNAVVSDIMLLSKALTGGDMRDFSEISIAELLDEGLAGLRAKAAKRNVRLLIRPQDDRFRLRGDVRLLLQAIGKLADNAIKSSPPGGVVELSAHVRKGGEIVISVKDEGVGLSAQKLKQCLQPFMQEDTGYARPAEGLGLGLPIAKAVCEAHGGELAIKTAAGQGLLAALVLPASLLAVPEGLKHV